MIFPGYQENTYVTADVYLLVVSLSIFTIVHSHYIPENFYQFVEAFAKVFENSCVFSNYFFRPQKHLSKSEYFFMLERYHLGQIVLRSVDTRPHLHKLKTPSAMA